jgi:drug/metabolite transporter (DMT)-like permease
MTWLIILLAFAGYSVLNIAQAGQKLGLELMQRRRLLGGLVWVVCLLGTSVSALIGWYAVSIGSVSLVGAMAGSGLASLAVFSALVLKERIRTREIAGIVLLAVSAVLIGLFQEPFTPEEPSLRRLFVFLGLLCAAGALAWLVARRRHGVLGPVIAGLAGALGGFVPLFQKASASAVGRGFSFLKHFLEEEHWALAVANPFALVWIALSVASMIVIQFAYRHDRAVRLIPAFTSCTILVPVLGGVLVFRERLQALQWAGVALVLTGLLLLTARGARDSP